MATIRTVIVDTDNAYAGVDYVTLASAEATENGDISVTTGTDEYVVFECYATSGTADSAVVFDGWTTEPTNYIEVTGKNDAAEYHDGVWNDNLYRIVEASGEDCIDNYEAHFRVTGLQLHNNNAASIKMGIRDFESSDATAQKYHSYNLIKGSSSATYNMRGISISLATGGVSRVFNNIIYDVNTAATSHGVYVSGGTNYVYNNTILGGTFGVYRNDGTGIIINNLCQNQVTSAIEFSGSIDTSSGYNVIEDPTLVADSASGTGVDLTTGTATSYTANKLNDTGAGLSVAVVGSVVVNTTDVTYAYVTVVDSDTQLTLSSDIFDTGNEAYRVTSNIYGVVKFVDSGSDNYLLDYLDELAMLHGVNKYADASLPVTDDILGTSRGNENTDFYDIGAFHSLEYGHVVDPDSGTGFDYTSLSTWESNEQTSLGINEKNKICTAVCRCTGGTNDTTAVTINGWDVGTATYPKIWTDPDEAYRHPGYWITGNYYRLVVSNAAAIDNREDGLHIEGLQIQISSVNSTDQCGIVSQYFSAATITHMKFVGNVIKGAGGAIGANQYHFGIQVKDYATASSGQIDIYNNVIFDFGGVENYNNGGIEFYNSSMYVDCFGYNNTIQNCSKGFESTGTGTGSYLTIKNNLIDGGHAGYNLVSSSTFGTTSTHNIWDGAPSATATFGATHATGTATSYTANKLNDSGGGLSTAQVNSVVKNTTDTTYTYVTVVDSDTQLTLNADIFDTGNEGYEVYTNMTGAVTFQSAGSDIFLLGASDTAAKDKGKDLSADGNLPITDDILGTSRPQ